MSDTPDDRPAGDEEQRALERIRERARNMDSLPGLVRAARKTRELLPGDTAVGDPMSTAANRPSDLLARYLADVDQRPSTVRELGLGAVQVYQALAEAQGRGRGTQRLAILFTDLVGFSKWALEAGDAQSVELLRAVDQRVDSAIKAHGGRLVKRLGDGHMAVFDSAAGAVEAAREAQEELHAVEIAGYQPVIRAGVHVGRPRKIGGDYLGVDVNIAARVAEAAKGDQVLVSEPARAELESDAYEFSRRRGFRAKGAPSDLDVYAVSSPG